MKEDWKYAFLVSGTLSVMMGGVTVRHKWYASNWDTLIKVKFISSRKSSCCYESECDSLYISYPMQILSQVYRVQDHSY